MEKKPMVEAGAETETGVELMGNSSVMREEDNLLKNTLKNSPSSIPSMPKSIDGLSLATTPQKLSKFKQ
jgi:hypothetical protein